MFLALLGHFSWHFRPYSTDTGDNLGKTLLTHLVFACGSRDARNAKQSRKTPRVVAAVGCFVLFVSVGLRTQARWPLGLSIDIAKPSVNSDMARYCNSLLATRNQVSTQTALSPTWGHLVSMGGFPLGV